MQEVDRAKAARVHAARLVDELTARRETRRSRGRPNVKS
jgi:hypothetical protein